MINPPISEHYNRIINRNGTLTDIELKNLEIVRDKYDLLCSNYIKISNIFMKITSKNINLLIIHKA